MPQDSGEPHPLSDIPLREDYPNLSQTSKTAVKEVNDRVVSISWEELKKRAEVYVVSVKKENPDIPEAEIEGVADLVFGPFRQEQQTFNRNESEEAKRLRASLQHNLVHAAIDGQRESASEEFVRTTYSTLSLLDRLARTEVGKDSGLYIFMAGVRGELATAKSLMKDGYKVFLPDYMQDPTEMDEGADEITSWDVRSGIDMVAEKDDHVFLIDSKGEFMRFSQAVSPNRHMFQDNPENRRSSSVYIHPHLGVIPEELKEELARYTNRVKRLTIYNPTAEDLWPKLPVTNDPKRMRKALGAYTVPKHAEDAIIRQVQKVKF